MQKSENQCDSLTARTRLRTFPVFEVSSFLLVLFILFMKNPDLYLYPALIPDDKLLFVYHFHRFINENNTSSLFYFYANSILLIPNICATGFVAVLPLEWVPRAFAIFSLLVTTAVNWLFCLRPYSVFVSSRLARLMICLLIAMLPIGSWPLQASLLWQSWNFLILIVLLLIIEPVINNRKRLFIIPLIVVSIFSTPGSIIFLPWFLIGAVRLLYERKFLRFCFYAMSGASIVIYAFWGMNRLGSYYNEVRLHLGEIIRVGLLTGLPRVMLESFSSLPFRMTIHDISPVIPFLLSMLIFIIACIAAYAASKKNPYISGLALFAGYVNYFPDLTFGHPFAIA